MAKYEDIPMIDVEDLTDLELLKTNCIFSDGFMELPKERQTEIYDYCKAHATIPACRENLKQIRYAVTRIYFGY